MKSISRRIFIKLAFLMGLGAVMSWLSRVKSIGQDPEDWHVFLPVVFKGDSSAPTPTPTSTPGPPKVVHIYSADATSWDYASDYFFEYVNQTQVNDMVDRGIRELTGASTVADAWRILLSAVTDYAPGKGIAIKVNFNNCNECNEMANELDAIIEPVNAVIRGLKLMGVQESDIWVYEAWRCVPYRFVNGCDYPDVKFFNKSGSGCVTPVTWDSTDPSAVISFSGGGLADKRLTDLLVDATYLINMPILRGHGIAGVTLGLKHHFGSIWYPKDLHPYIDGRSDSYDPSWSPLLDIYENPNILDKTVLTIGDGLFGNWQINAGPPLKWNTFKNNLGTDAPNSLFFAVDPVAIDSVMSDFIKAEYPPRVEDWAVNYLRLAEDDGLGIFEQGDPWGSGYSKIDYVRMIL